MPVNRKASILMDRRTFVSAVAAAGMLANVPAYGDEISELKERATQLGVKISTPYVVVPDELDWVKDLTKSQKLRKDLTQAVKEENAINAQILQAKQAITQLRTQQVTLNAQLTAVRPGDVTTNNRLVGALRALDGQMTLIEEQQTQREDLQKASRTKTNTAREAYVQLILDMRKRVDEVLSHYETQSTLPEMQEFLSAVEKAAGKKYDLGPSPQFKTNVAKLKALEDTVLSESIALREEGRTYFLPVVLNGKHTHEMVLDSGASLISLPLKLAEEVGLHPTDKDQKILLGLADGRQIEGWKMRLTSVRVGKFTVENVDCAVLGPEAVNAEPLLGMAFLGNFKFEIDASAKSLTMVKVTVSAK